MTDIATKRNARRGEKLVTFDELGPDHCRWPVGDPRRGPFGFCGAPRQGTGPYCEAHRQMARVPRDGETPVRERV